MYLAELTSPQLAALPRETPIIFPIAALEQHGGHLPVLTDTQLVGEVVRRAEAALASQAVFAPVLWLGNSDHHLDFPGTLSAPPRPYLDLLVGLAENVLRHGFKRVIFLNGHGGNDVPGRQAVFELRQRHRDTEGLLLLMATYWSLGGRPFERSVAGGWVQQEMGHACEWETSMMLRLDPAKVGSFGSLDPVDATPPFHPAHRGWVTRERTSTGHIGHPAAASQEKGEVLFEVFSADVVRLLERVRRWDGVSWSEA